MKRLLRKQNSSRRGGDSNQDVALQVSASSPHMQLNNTEHTSNYQNQSPRSPVTWTATTETSVHSLQQQQEGTSRMQPISQMARGTSAPSSLRADTGGDEGSSTLPTTWRIDNTSLRHSDPLCVYMNSTAKSTVYSNIPLILKQLRIESDFHPGVTGPTKYHTQVYYFEVTLTCNQLSSVGGIAIGFMSVKDLSGVWPGELPNSIGWGSDGLFVSGRRLEAGPASYFRDGDVIGCGVELGGMYGVFFTMNGKMMVHPTPATAFGSKKDLPWYPVTSFRHGNSNFLVANFGTDPRTPFQWQGSNQLTITQLQSSGWSRAHTSDFSQRPISSVGRTDQMQRAFLHASSAPSQFSEDPRHQIPLSRSMPTGIAQLPNTDFVPNSQLSPISSSQTFVDNRPSYFGERNHHKSLEDDDPADMSATIHDHFNLKQPSVGESKVHFTSSLVNPQVPRAPQELQRVHSTPTYSSAVPIANDNQSSTGMLNPRTNEASSRLEQRRKDRANRRTPGRAESTSSCSPVPLSSSLSNSSHSALTKDDSITRIDTQPMNPQRQEPVIPATGTSSLVLPTGNDVSVAKEHAQALLDAAKQVEIDGINLRNLLSFCKADQEKLRLKLSNALEEADAIDNLEELFAVNDEICSAIDAGNQALEREKGQSKKKKKPMDGPTIQLLVDNEDIFSLICMLRAPNEKRAAAALALMRFARGNEALRNEIRSSGGMHSFLTLFRTKGTSESLKIIVSMAVAYILPSFVASAQTSASVGLKIIECLRYLVISSPVETIDFSISRPEMLKAASMGVNVLWINAIQPLLILESSNDQSSKANAEAQPSVSLRINRARARSAGGILNQAQESIEIHELTELAVTLITHVAKISDSPSEDPLDVGYNIVEQVCEVDDARPIAVREGLLTTLVEWVRSNQVEKVRPAASALRYLISINDKYMAGWIHSQVVSEGIVAEIVKLLNQSVGHDTRVAVAQMLSALCVAPHTRTAVVEAKCVSYLVALLYEHSSPASAEIVYYAATSLLQLAAGAMIRATALMINDASGDAGTRDYHGTVIK